MVMKNSILSKIYCRKCKRYVYLTTEEAESINWRDIKKSQNNNYTHSSICNICFERNKNAVSPGRNGSSGD